MKLCTHHIYARKKKGNTQIYVEKPSDININTLDLDGVFEKLNEVLNTG